MRQLLDDCWICQNLHQPAHLVYYESATSIAKLNPDQLFKGYTFLALKWHEENLHQLLDRQRKLFLEDMSNIGNALHTALQPDRLNYELLGNAQAHLHWHIIPRYKSDPMWGRPIWAGNRPRRRLNQNSYEELVKIVRNQLEKTRTSTRTRRE